MGRTALSQAVDLEAPRAGDTQLLLQMAECGFGIFVFVLSLLVAASKATTFRGFRRRRILCHAEEANSSGNLKGVFMKVLVIGGSGLIGSQVVAQLTELGHEAVPASPRTGVDAITGEGLAEAVVGVHTVVDVANSPSWADDDVLNFFTTSSRNLLEAGRAAGVQHHVALSIVGADRAARSGYMRAKVAQEKVIVESGSPYTIVRATQFFEFVDGIADSLTAGDTVRAPHGAFQPISAGDVATAVTRAATANPANRVINIAGPDKQGMDDFIRTRFAATGDARQVVTDADAQYFGAALDERSIVPVDGEEVTLYPTSFSDWMAARAPSETH